MQVWASATLPDDDVPEMQGYVRGSQEDRNGATTWPIYDGPSCWDASKNTYLLHHDRRDHGTGLRGYIPQVMEALRCHQDLQYDNSGKGMTAYVVKYVPKFSDAATDELLDDDAEMNGDETAAAILTKYKPFEPEMTLQLFASHCHQWEVGTVSKGVREFQVPWVTKTDTAEDIRLVVYAYETSEWRDERMSALEYLRKTVDGGRDDIAPYLKRLHEEDAIKKGYAFHQKQGKSWSLRTYRERCKKSMKKSESGHMTIDEAVRQQMQEDGHPTNQEPGVITKTE